MVVELLKIDNSRPAVNIKLVSTPNKWRRESSGNGSNPPGGTSERQERYRDFWQTLTDSLRDEHNFTQARRSQHRSWFSFSAGFGEKARFGASFAQGGGIRTEVYINSTDREWNKDLFDELENRRESIESDLSDALVWERLDNRKACRISAMRSGSIDDDSEILEEIHI